MISKELNDICEKLYVELDTGIKKAKTIKNFDLESTRSIVDLADMIVSLVEEHSLLAQKLTGKEKKEVAIKILNKVINIKLKFVPRPIMEKLEGFLLGLMIDLIVSFLNKKFDKKWGVQ